MSPRVLHVISDLPVGGAELMLFRLLSRTTHESAVVSLKSVGPVGERLRARGVPVDALGLRGGVPDPRGLARLARRIRGFRPDVIQTWMYHADLLGGLAARLATRAPVLWNLRQSNLDPAGSKRTTIWTALLCARLSHHLPEGIVCCSDSARTVHAALGYDERRMLVIPNGFDTDAFRPDPAARAEVRRSLGLESDAPLIGLAGRFDPQKDHRTFAAAAARLLRERPDVHFVLCGRGIEPGNPELARILNDAGVAHRAHRLGCRDDMPRITAALDLATSSSAFGEGFPNVIGEAMACGVPVVVTDVGDSAALADGCGVVVPPRDPAALAAAWQRILALDEARRYALGAAGRQRILREFSLEKAVARYEDLYRDAARARPGRTGTRRMATNP